MPIAWQGRVFLVFHLALILGVALLIRQHPLALLVAVLTVTLLPLALYAARTQGMRWRWRGDQ